MFFKTFLSEFILLKVWSFDFRVLELDDKFSGQMEWIATSTNTVTAEIKQIPNQPISFKVKCMIHYVNVSVLIKFSQKTSVFTLIIISSP